MSIEVFRPGQSYELAVDDPCFDESAALTNEHLSRIGSDYFFVMADCAEAEPETGIKGVLVPPEPEMEVSRVAAILVPGTYGNDVWPHKVALGATVAHQGRLDGIRDAEGYPVGALVLSAPSKKTSFGLGITDLGRVYTGDFNPVGRQHAELMQCGGLNELKGVFANSLAAAETASIVAEASRGLDVRGRAALVEYPLQAKLGRLGLGFWREGQEFKGQVAEEDIAVINEIFATGTASPHFESGIARRGFHNAALFHGLAQRPSDRLYADLTALAWHNMQATVVAAGNTRISAPHVARSMVAGVVEMMPARVSPSFVEVSGTNHSLADRLGRARWLAARALRPLPSAGNNR